MKNMKKCNICNADIAQNAKICPKCGAKNKKPIYKRVWFWILIIIIIGIIIGNNSNNTTNDNPQDTSTTSTAQQTTQNDYDVNIISSNLSKDYSGNDILIVEYEYTNNTDKSIAFSVAVTDKAFQNGVECSNIVLSEDIDSTQPLNEVKPNTSYNLKVAYALQDTETPVEIEVSNLFSNEPFYKHTIDLK